MTIKFINKDNRKSLFQAISMFEFESFISINTIRILNDNSAILFYDESIESSLINRSKR